MTKHLLLLLLSLMLSLTVSAGDANQRRSTIHLKSGEVVTGVITSSAPSTLWSMA